MFADSAAATPRSTAGLLQQRIGEYGLTGRPIETWFDLNDFDEGRDPVAARAWEKCCREGAALAAALSLSGGRPAQSVNCSENSREPRMRRTRRTGFPARAEMSVPLPSHSTG